MTDPRPHLVLLPLSAQGHIIPMLDMARLLAERGARTTLVTTPVNAARVAPLVKHARASGLPVQLVELAFPAAAYGLPEGCENTDLVHSWDLFTPFYNASCALHEPLESYLRAQSPRPDCMIVDSCNPWAAAVASRLGIPRLIFHGPSCFYLLVNLIIIQHKLDKNIAGRELEPFLVPEFPVYLETSIAQAVAFFNSPSWESVRPQVLDAEATADGVVINSFDDLELPFVECYKRLVGKNVWTIGPSCLYNKDTDVRAARGNRAAIGCRRLTAWLDSKEQSSVVYVSFGSFVPIRPKQFIELGSGLEATGRPFIWAVRDAEKEAEVKEWLCEFEKRTRDRGLIIHGWAPQLVVLNHPAVGGFLTHCGWNSMLEAICAGVPMVTWPVLADQFLNEKLVVGVLLIGVAVGVKVPAFSTSEDCDELVTREDVERAVSRVMEDGEGGRERRERVGELAAKACKAMEEGGSSYVNAGNLIEHLALHSK